MVRRNRLSPSVPFSKKPCASSLICSSCESATYGNLQLLFPWNLGIVKCWFVSHVPHEVLSWIFISQCRHFEFMSANERTEHTVVHNKAQMEERHPWKEGSHLDCSWLDFLWKPIALLLPKYSVAGIAHFIPKSFFYAHQSFPSELISNRLRLLGRYSRTCISRALPGPPSNLGNCTYCTDNKICHLRGMVYQVTCEGSGKNTQARRCRLYTDVCTSTGERCEPGSHPTSSFSLHRNFHHTHEGYSAIKVDVLHRSLITSIESKNAQNARVVGAFDGVEVKLYVP